MKKIKNISIAIFLTTISLGVFNICLSTSIDDPEYVISETIQASALKYQDPWMLWKNDGFNNMENGQSILLEDIKGTLDIAPLEYAVARKINGVIIVSQIDKSSFDELQNQEEFDNNIETSIFDAQNKIGSSIDVIQKAFPGLQTPMKQINVSSKENPLDKNRDDGFVTLGTADQIYDTYTFYPEGMYPDAMEQTLIHESAHVLGGSIGIGESSGWRKSIASDKKVSKYILNKGFVQDKTNTILDVSADSIHSLIFGDDGITEYGKDSSEEDWAESFCWYVYDKIHGGIGTTDNGERVRFSEVYPNRSKFIDKWYAEELNKKEKSS